MNSLSMEIGFHQFFEPTSSTYTYLLWDLVSLEALIIDTVRSEVASYSKFCNERKLKLKWILDTHIHADHVTGAGELRKLSGAKTALGAATKLTCCDRLLKDGETLQCGKMPLKALSTPGHTNGCTSYYVPGYVFTGDTLLIGGCGRTDFQEGNSAQLYESIHQKLFTLPPETKVYPGHDYKQRTHSTIETEKNTNARLGNGKTKDEFQRIMADLKLDPPKQIRIAVPANMKCGLE